MTSPSGPVKAATGKCVNVNVLKGRMLLSFKSSAVGQSVLLDDVQLHLRPVTNVVEFQTHVCRNYGSRSENCSGATTETEPERQASFEGSLIGTGVQLICRVSQPQFRQHFADAFFERRVSGKVDDGTAGYFEGGEVRVLRYSSDNLQLGIVG